MDFNELAMTALRASAVYAFLLIVVTYLFLLILLRISGKRTVHVTALP